MSLSIYGAFLGSVLIHAFILFYGSGITTPSINLDIHSSSSYLNIRLVSPVNDIKRLSVDSERNINLAKNVSEEPPSNNLIRKNFGYGTPLLVMNRPPKVLSIRNIELPRDLGTITGMVIIEFVITENDKASDFSILYSSPSGVFDSLVQESLLNSKFEHAIRDGQNVSTTIKMEFIFNGATANVKYLE